MYDNKVREFELRFQQIASRVQRFIELSKLRRRSRGRLPDF